MACSICRRNGHYAPTCPQKRLAANRSYKCGRCHQQGHNVRSCEAHVARARVAAPLRSSTQRVRAVREQPDVNSQQLLLLQLQLLAQQQQFADAVEAEALALLARDQPAAQYVWGGGHRLAVQRAVRRAQAQQWSIVTTNIGANLKVANYSQFAADVRRVPAGDVNVWQEVSSDGLVPLLAKSIGHAHYCVVAVKAGERMGISWASAACKPTISKIEGPMHELTRLSSAVWLTLPDGCTILAVHLARGGGDDSKGSTQRQWLAQVMRTHRPHIAVGDMNCPPNELINTFPDVFGSEGMYHSEIPDSPAYQTTPKLKNGRSGPIDHIWTATSAAVRSPVSDQRFYISDQMPSIVRVGGVDQFVIDHFPVVFQFQS